MVEAAQDIVPKTTPFIRQGLEYWCEKRGNRAMPCRADIDPREIKGLLPHIALLDVLQPDTPDDVYDYRFRLIGSHIEEHTYGLRAGTNLSTYLPYRPHIQLWQNLIRVTKIGSPGVHAFPYEGPHEEFKFGYDAILPLSEDGVKASMLMCVVQFLSRDDFTRMAVQY